ncbi:hypothetical protein [Borreliella valaisiana]|nr:hypothetical protein [Borreliella valaisiana]
MTTFASSSISRGIELSDSDFKENSCFPGSIFSISKIGGVL